MVFTTAQLTLPKAESEAVFSKAAEGSAVMRLGKQHALGLGGASIPVFSSNIEASWVDEAGVKPKGEVSANNIFLTPKKLAVIVPVSNEAIRASGDAISAEAVNSIADAFAKKIDSEVFYGGNQVANPISGSNKTVALGTGDSIYADVVSAKAALYADRKKFNGMILDYIVDPMFDLAVTNTGVPLFNETPYTDVNAPVRVGRVLGANTVFTEELADETSGIVGAAGDFSKVHYGVLSEINVQVVPHTAYTDPGSGQLVSTTERNVTLLLVETEVAVAVADPNAFVTFTQAAAPVGP